jgi:hypothetical protein
MIVTIRIRNGLIRRYFDVEWVTVMARKLLRGAVSAVGLAADLARHIAWYVSHQVNGHPRDPARSEARAPAARAPEH